MLPAVQIINSCQQVVQSSTDVTIDQDQLEPLAAQLAQVWPVKVARQEPFHAVENPEQRLIYVVLLDTINFGSGYPEPFERLLYGGGYWEMAQRLRQVVCQGHWQHPAQLIELQPTTLAALLQALASSPLVAAWTRALQELGQWLCSNYQGSYQALIQSLQQSGQRLVYLLSALPTFGDRACYGTQLVYFYKKAQIMVADLYFAFHHASYGHFNDMHRLTVMADNLLPALLVYYGVLRLQPSLTQALAAGEYLPANSIPEIELRANTIVACQHLLTILHQDYKQPWQAYELDRVLWEMAQPLLPQLHPHKTMTPFY